MMQARKFFWLLIIGIFSTSVFAVKNNSVHKKHHPIHLRTRNSGYAQLSLPHFDSIQAAGNFNITIVGGREAVSMDRDEIYCVNANVVNNTLVLNYIPPLQKDGKPEKPEDYPTINVRISMPALEGIDLLGNSSLMTNNVRSYGLNIAANGVNYVNLDGVVNINKIYANGDSNISIHWVNSNDLFVAASGNSQIYLAGVAKIFQVRLEDDATLNAKYLRADVAMVQTKDYSVADVLAKNSLYAFATDFSNIYYYKSPVNYLDHTEISGNALQLEHWQ